MKKIRWLALMVFGGFLVPAGCGQVEHQAICGGGYLLCDYDCVDPIVDPYNCGSCGLVCMEDEVCYMGICRAESEIESLEYVTALNRYEPESARTWDRLRTFETDELEACEARGQIELTRCGEDCVNTLTDRSHCGECFNSCTFGTFCRSGECTPECPPGLTNCDGMCVNLLTFRLHCGACNRPCESGQMCDGGVCVLSCRPGLTACGGSCVNVRFDRENCGDCGQACAAGEACVNSECTSECPGDEANCSGVCVDLMTDLEHCGLCGHACGMYETCVLGSCESY
jgi:hypothetical protein